MRLIVLAANNLRSLEGIVHAEGSTMRIGNAWVQQYHLKDHLDNVRVIVDQSKVVKETNDYYAFGSRWVDASSVVASPANRYRYNGMEEQSWGNLGYYDYNARFYNPAIGRFSSIDPLAEKYMPTSPYVYVANNPIKFIDPTGRDILIHYGANEPFRYTGKETITPTNTYVQQVIMAYNHNVKNGGGDYLKTAAENKNITLNIRQTDTDSYANSSKNIQTTFWNPELGLKLIDGKVLSPATMLEHEAAHVVLVQTGESNSEKRIEDPNNP